MKSEIVNILVVDDDAVDVETVRRSLNKMKIANPLYTAKDGLEALNILRGENGQKKLPHPYLILLDINMPKMNGLEFLAEVRKDPDLHSSIIFVLTTSDEGKDRVEAYNHNVSGYLLKTNVGNEFVGALSLLEHYWKYVEFPLK